MIVLARGGGSVEDLLPFSDETLCRAIAACRTPVISAIGHEPDNPLCDLVADLRAATPTDAAKKVVPDTAAEQAMVADLRRRSAQALRNWVQREATRAGPVTQPPGAGRPTGQALTARSEECIEPDRHCAATSPGWSPCETDRVGHLAARLATLGPAATLARGYAVVQMIPSAEQRRRCCGRSDDAPAGTRLRVRVADGAIAAVSEGQTDGRS